MNAQNAHLYLPLVQALADGKTIQENNHDCIPPAVYQWNDMIETKFSRSAKCYRIKPEPRTFEIARRKSDGLIKNHVGNFINNEWERITVQEVLR